MNALQNKYGPEGFTVVGISTDRTGFDAVSPVIEQYNVNYPMTIMNGSFESGFGPIAYIPTTILIDRNNRIVERYAIAQPAATLEEFVRQLVTQPASLQASIQAGLLSLHWPTNATGYRLQGAFSSLDWTNLNAEVSVSGDQNQVTLSATNAARWFRLIRN